MKDKNKDIFISVMFFGFLITVFFLQIIILDKEISNSERRKLQQFPSLNITNLKTGNFTKEFDKYVIDQFAFRDIFLNIKSFFEFNLLNKKDNNGYFIKNNMIFKNEMILNENSVINLTNKINNIKDKYLTTNNLVYYSIIPNKNYYLKDKNYLKLDYKKIEEIMNNKLLDINYISIFDKLYLEAYYKSDIHWDQIKILDVSNVLLSNMGKTFDYNLFNKTNCQVKLYGSYSHQMPYFMKSDNLCYFTNDVINNAKTYNVLTNEISLVYNLDKKDSVDRYDIFISGAAPIIEITGNSKETKELIIFRDSFASSIAPLMLNSYKKITLVDTRYINPNLIGEYIDFNDQDILFLYSFAIINNSYVLK